MQTYRYFLGLTLANTNIICKQMNHNAATLRSSASCCLAFHETIAAPQHMHLCTPTQSVSLVKDKRDYWPPLQPESQDLCLEGWTCLKGRQRAWGNAPVLKALSSVHRSPVPTLAAMAPKTAALKRVHLPAPSTVLPAVVQLFRLL